MSSGGGLSDDLLRRCMLPQIRYNIETILLPLWGTAEERAKVKALVASKTDAEIEEVWRRYCEAAEDEV